MKTFNYSLLAFFKTREYKRYMRKHGPHNGQWASVTESGNRQFQLIILLFFIFLFSTPFQSDAISAGTNGLNLNYTLTIDNPSNHILNIRLRIENIVEDQLRLSRKAGYQTNPSISDFSVKDSSGNSLSYKIDFGGLNDSIETFTINTGSINSILVEYDVNLAYFPQDLLGGHSYWSLDSSYGAVESQLVLLQPTFDSEISSCRIYTMLPSGWKFISRLIDKGAYYEANTDDIVANWGFPKFFKFFMWGPMIFGELDEYFKTIGGLEVEVAFYENSNLQEEMSDYIFSIMQYFSDTIGPLNDPKKSEMAIKYMYVLLHETTRNVHCGDHIYGQFTISNNEFHSNSRYRGDAHTIAHTWFSHFGLLSDVVYVDSWISEAIIQFYAVKSLQATGIWNSSEVNEHLIGWYNDYTNYILGTQYDVPVYPASGWLDFPNDRLEGLYTYGIKNIIWYEKEPLIYWLLDQEISDLTDGKKSFDDVWRYFHDKYPGSFQDEISYDELLSICNYVTGKDLTNFFTAYVSGYDPLPFYLENGLLKIDDSKVPEATSLSNLDFVKLRLIWGDQGVDSDGDGLSDELEGVIGTNVSSTDTDGDGLNDRAEYGVIIDGQSGEYGLDQPLIQDPQGDSESAEEGTDIKNVYAKVFLNENDTRELYLVLSTWDNQHNPDIFYEIHLTISGDSYQYRFANGTSYLWHEENGSYVDISDNKVEARFKDLLEVKIPLELVGNPASATVRAITRTWTPNALLDDIDWTSDVSMTLQPQIFVTDPTNPDNDGDGANDGYEIQSGTDPADSTSYPAGGTKPSVTGDSATSITCCSAMLSGKVNPNGVSTIVVFEYGSDTNYGSTVSATQSPLTGSSTQRISANLQGLTSGATYHFRVRASNSNWTSYGTGQTFTTTVSLPTVSTTFATSVTSTSATLNGTVNPNGETTTYYFEYGTDTSYGTATSSSSAGSGTSAVSVNAAISGLISDTTYHYRLVATNSEGASYGDDKTFSTTILYVESSALCGGNTPCYSTIQSAITAASSGATIKITEEVYDEDLEMSSSKNLTPQGGWDSTFTTQSATSTVNSITISNGAIAVDKLVIQ